MKQELITYNQDDCKALECVAHAISNSAANEGAPSIADSQTKTGQIAPFQKAPSLLAYGEHDYAFPEIARITKCAYWDYQRDRVYVRTNKRIKEIARKRASSKSASIVPVNKIIRPTGISQCTNCGSARFFMNGRHQRMIYDLRFSSGGIRRWVVKRLVDHFKCKGCGLTFSSDKTSGPRCRYGSVIRAYVIYCLIELHIAQFHLAKIVRRIFGLPLGQTTIGKIKSRAAEFYRGAFQEICALLVEGHLVHADETRVSVDGQDSYVWVFTSMEEVVYFWSETREAKTATEFLTDFTGVLVSDFYAAYDSLECPQQKCLIHLIRDLNDAVLKEPFNEEFNGIAQEFAELVQTILATIDRFGLKAYFLRKHEKDVQNFFKYILGRQYETESAIKLQKRLLRNREKLFTFLRYDNVPWNNNNAEHAVKAFGRGIRDQIDGRTSKQGIFDYLVLLSIQQTCEYRGVDFLSFLRSGQERLSGYSKT